MTNPQKMEQTNSITKCLNWKNTCIGHRKEVLEMTKQKREKERAWTVRKQDQHPHGKVKSFKELSQGKDEA